MNELIFSLRDLYPNIATTQEETSVKANPDAEDQTVLNEDSELSEKADNNNASTKMILLAIVIIVALVVSAMPKNYKLSFNQRMNRQNG